MLEYNILRRLQVYLKGYYFLLYWSKLRYLGVLESGHNMCLIEPFCFIKVYNIQMNCTVCIIPVAYHRNCSTFIPGTLVLAENSNYSQIQSTQT